MHKKNENPTCDQALLYQLTARVHFTIAPGKINLDNFTQNGAEDTVIASIAASMSRTGF
ncbi:MAG: hypothetical protein ABSD73_09565 [Candidatus Bathyarchaeia archaeon]|jgi:hypothetical protein